MTQHRAHVSTQRATPIRGEATSDPAAALLATVTRVRHVLLRIFWGRAVILGISAGLASWVVLLLASRQLPLVPGALVVSAIFALLLVGFTATRHGAHIGLVRTALWMEEQLPAGFALVTLVELDAARVADSGAHASPSTRARLAAAYLESSGGFVRATRITNASLKGLAVHRLRDPVIFALLTGLMLGVMPNRKTVGTLHLRDHADTNGDKATAARGPAPIGRWTIRVEPPAYTRASVQQLGDVDGIAAISGSTVTMTGSGDPPSSIVQRLLVDSTAAAVAPANGTTSLPAVPSPKGWTSTFTTTAVPTEVRVSRGQANRLLLIEGYADSLPQVRLSLPLRDTVLRSAVGQITLEATLHDDLGLSAAAFELIVSSGEGERFTARTLRVGAQRYAGVGDVTLRLALDLDAMRLGPGDIVHLRAVARDAHPSATREWGTSETRALRIARPSEYDSVSVEPAPPPEVDKSLLSQRMLLLLTERLEQRRGRLSAALLVDETGKLARDQTRLRLAVGDAVFQRLGTESSAEHAEGAEKGIRIVDGKLVMPPAQELTGTLEEGDDSPVIGINKPLLEAYNAMWDAGRALELGDRRGAIPHMRVALAAIERARAASRLYLRGKPPVVIPDLARIRLAGKDTGVTNFRSTRAALASATLEREARLLRAAALAATNVGAARDSLAVLRLESLGTAPAFATSLAEVIDALRRGGDLTGMFVRARRSLGDVARAPSVDWSRTGPP